MSAKPMPRRDCKVVVAVTAAALAQLDRKAKEVRKTRAALVRDLLNAGWRTRFPKKKRASKNRANSPPPSSGSSPPDPAQLARDAEAVAGTGEGG